MVGKSANSQKNTESFGAAAHYLLNEQETAGNRRGTVPRGSPDSAGQTSVGAGRPGRKGGTAGEGRSDPRRESGATLFWRDCLGRREKAERPTMRRRPEGGCPTA